MIRRTLLAIALLALALPAVAGAVPPVITSAGSQDMYPTATFNTFGADWVVLQVATTPDRATDGDFLSPNQEIFTILTDGEAQGGYWKYGSRLKPGNYFMLMRTSLSLQEFSAVVPFTVPVPNIKWKAKAKRRKFLSLRYIDLTLKGTPLGEDRQYKVCYRKAKRKRCKSSTVDGSDWSQASEDTIELNAKRLDRKTKFTWYVDGKRVASKNVKVR